ncbi:MAG: phosphoenolpyruvate synthase [Anaerolineae bacterium]|nr:phosphoenolpyruvate synthase [Anaerolineae bacterium]
MSQHYVLHLNDSQADLETVGGKGASLARLATAGLPVPGGFHITTEAYRQFVAASGLQSRILAALEVADASQPATLDTASQAIHLLFTQADIPTPIADAVAQAYSDLSAQPIAVAVRSSATAEDLPDASFAGQQETYLNISGTGAVLEAVKKCWASLWTARAIGYRARQNIDPDSVALAVVVQELVFADAAGILFTANPLSGSRDEAVVNAAWGLGEAIVGGMVTPDTLTVDKASGRVLARETANKQMMTVRVEGGTEEQPVPEARRSAPVLDDKKAAELVQQGVQIEKLYGTPMDIEWTLKDGTFAIVQARPITALPDAPIEWRPPDPKGVYMRSSIVDLMPGPLSPLFTSLGISSLLRQFKPMTRRMIGAEGEFAKDYFTSIHSYGYMNTTFPTKTWGWILFAMIPAYPRLLRSLVPLWRDELHPEYQAAVAQYADKIPDRMSAAELWRDAQALVDAATYYISGLMFATMGASAGGEGLLTQAYNKMAKQEGDPPATTLMMGWDNIPIRAERSLYDLAMWCHGREDLAVYVLETPSDKLTDRLVNEQAPAHVDPEDWRELQSRFEQHLATFGHIVFQLDFAAPLPLDHPAPMLENIKMYLRGEGANPRERQRASEEKRIQTTETMLGRLRGLKLWAFRLALNWGQPLSAIREDALAEIGLAYPMLREMLRELGRQFVEADAIEQAEDIFWLEKEEIDAGVAALEGGKVLANLSDSVARRKAFQQKMKQITPPPMIPYKKRIMGIKTDSFIAHSQDAETGDTLKGVATSAGKVTAPACVLHGPEDFDQMKPGDVLVAGATTPAWTTLFAMASAVVTDIGGPLSHGSIVAREYGIPAVMGTGVATRRIQSGQMITVDGDAGTVELVVEAP